MVAPLVAAAVPVIAELAMNGLSMIGNAILAKGKQEVEDQLGVKIPDSGLSPEQVTVLKQKEAEHEKWLIDQAIMLDELYLKDRADARDMQKSALAQTDLFSKRFIYYFATVWSLFAIIYISFITFGEIPKENTRFADTILGFLLGTIVSAIINFFYGSSRSSQNKDDLVAEITKNVSKR